MRVTAIAMTFLLSMVYAWADLKPQAGSDAVDMAKLATIVDDMTPGIWFEIPNSSIKSVLVSREMAPFDGAIMGPKSVVESWSGSAYDGRCQWFFHGGGHNDYSGNGVYRYDLCELNWERLTDPSPLLDNPFDSKLPIPVDGKPVFKEVTRKGGAVVKVPVQTAPRSSHTYDGLIWVPNLERMIVFTGSVYRKGNSDGQVWSFDPVSRSWRRLKDRPHVTTTPYTALDPYNNTIISIAKNRAFQFNPQKNTYSRASKSFGWTEQGNSVYDPTRNIVWAIEKNGIFKIDNSASQRLGQRNYVVDRDEVSRMGDNYKEAGLVYNKILDALVIWPGKRSIWIYDITKDKLTEFPNPNGPAPSSTMIFSKWIYIEKLDVYAGYGSAHSGVWLYKLPNKPQVDKKEIAGLVRICPSDNFGINCDYQSIRAGLQNAKDGDTITILGGDYNKVGDSALC